MPGHILLKQCAQNDNRDRLLGRAYQTAVPFLLPRCFHAADNNTLTSLRRANSTIYFTGCVLSTSRISTRLRQYKEDCVNGKLPVMPLHGKEA